jgi:hypothetical protein
VVGFLGDGDGIAVGVCDALAAVTVSTGCVGFWVGDGVCEASIGDAVALAGTTEVSVANAVGRGLGIAIANAVWNAGPGVAVLPGTAHPTKIINKAKHKQALFDHITTSLP